MKRIKVTCAIIVFNKKVLVVQRSENMDLPLKWEFPGGKVEEYESEKDCIKREIKEELNIEININSSLKPSVFEYTDKSVELIPFIAEYVKGDIILAEHKQYLLLKKEELIDLDWADADMPIVKEYVKS